jgi:hypothetical protein
MKIEELYPRDFLLASSSTTSVLRIKDELIFTSQAKELLERSLFILRKLIHIALGGVVRVLRQTQPRATTIIT